jgi:hypothetical protein
MRDRIAADPSGTADSRQNMRRLRVMFLLISRTRVQLVFLLLIVVVGASFFVVNSQVNSRRMAVLGLFGARPMVKPYTDLRILLAGIETSRSGIDVWDSCKPCGTAVGLSKDIPFNYPAAVIWLGRFLPASITPDDADVIGSCIDAAFLLAAAFLLLSPRPSQAIFSFALLISPVVLMGLDRANYDLLIFCCVLVNVWLVNRWSNGAAYVTAFGLGLLKIFPVASIAALLRRTKGSLLWFAAIVAAEIAFIASSLKTIHALVRNTPQSAFGAYGYLVGFLYLRDELLPVAAARLAPRFAFPFLCVFCVVTFFLAFRYRKYLLHFVCGSGTFERTAFLSGAAIFSATFLIGSNYNYRLIFLLFLVPHLFAMLGHSDDIARRVARYVLVIMLGVFWAPGHFFPLTAPVETALTWMLFAFLSSTTIAALCLVLSTGSDNLAVATHP